MSAYDFALAAAVGTSPPLVHRLRSSPAVAPLPAQVAILEQRKAAARAIGLDLLPFDVLWVSAPRELTGATCFLPSGRVQVIVNANLFPGQLRGVLDHELAHVADAPHHADFTAAALEERALRYAARALDW